MPGVMKDSDRTTRLRPANPQRDEGLIFADYLDQAADGFFGFMLGHDVASIIAAAILVPGHALSYENVVFAEQGDVIVGMSLAYTGEEHREFSDEPLEHAAGRAARRMKVIRLVLAPLWRILENVPESDFYLQAIAVDPELRGSGIGSLLLNDVIERGTRNGSARLTLDVAARNDRARRLYARSGFVEAAEWPSLRFVPTRFVRMARPL